MPAKRLLQEISRCNQRCIADAGDIDPSQIAMLLEAAFATSTDRHRLMLGLAEYIGSAVVGVPPELDAWTPLEAFPHLTAASR